MSRSFELRPASFSDTPSLLRVLCAAHAVGFLIIWLTYVVGWSLPHWLSLSFMDLREHYAVWQPVTYLFLHGSVFSLVFACLVLWWFGGPLIAQWGEREFLKYYFLCGSGAGLLACLLYPRATFAGWEAAEFGLLVAFGMVHADSDITLWFVLRLPARYLALLSGLVSFFSGPPSLFRMLLILLGSGIGYAYMRWGWIAGFKIETLLRGLARERPRRAVERVAPRGGAIDDEVDRILDKISAHGTDSLSAEERDLLRRAAQKRKPGGYA